MDYKFYLFRAVFKMLKLHSKKFDTSTARLDDFLPYARQDPVSKFTQNKNEVKENKQGSNWRLFSLLINLPSHVFISHFVYKNS